VPVQLLSFRDSPSDVDLMAAMSAQRTQQIHAAERTSSRRHRRVKMWAPNCVRHRSAGNHGD
jgi:hypothetical protein